MKKNIILFMSIASSVLMLTGYASAHERDTYKIGDKEYTFVVGSLGEPVIVDDKTGVDFHLTQKGGAMPMGMAMSDEAVAGTPIIGAEKTLKVEISAGDQKKTFAIEPAWNQPGAYTAPFFPTIQTTYTYRFFGTLNGVSIDIPFTCVAGKVSESSEDKTMVKLSAGVTRENKIGGFGCPESKADYAFPGAVSSNYELQQSVRELHDASLGAANVASTANAFSMAGIAAGVIGIILGAVAIVQGRKKTM